MNNLLNINPEIEKFFIQNSSITFAMIIHKKGWAAMMMPIILAKDEKRYKIWENLPSLAEADLAAREFGKDMFKINFVHRYVNEIPKDIEKALIACFFLNSNSLLQCEPPSFLERGGLFFYITKY